MFKHLFEPIEIKSMRLKNRVILPAMGTRMANEKSEVTQRLIDYHVARAKGGCALNIVEVSSVHTPSAPANFISLSEDHYVDGHKKLTKAIHEAGGQAGIQLWQGSIAVGMDPKAKILVASDMPIGEYTLPAITVEEIKEIVKCYGDAARRSVEAGYDCIEFHCAHNYLPHSFLSGGFNYRTDEYGGNAENRSRFPLECIREIRKNIPDSMPLFMRIGAHDDYLPNGMTIEDTIEFCKLAKEAGIDVLDVSRGNIVTAATIYEVPPVDLPRGFNVDNASRIRKETGMLTIAVGRINTARFADEILADDKADMIIMGRAQLADPEFCNKALAEKTDDIVHCIACNQGCFDGFCDVVHYPFITCLRNPALGYEKEHTIDPTTDPKKVLVIGGGMAGMEAARVLKLRGHEPIVYEAIDHLGGQFITAGQSPGKEEMKAAAISFEEQIVRADIKVTYNNPVTKETFEIEKPDEVIIAIGASCVEMNLKGMKFKPMHRANDILDGLTKASGAVCVIGGGLVGLEAADYLATEGHAVHVIEMKDEVGVDLGSIRKIAVMQKIAELKVETTTNATCLAIEEGGVLIDYNGEEKVIQCDSVVMAVGAKPNDSSMLVGLCNDFKLPYHIIGDAKEARRALNAVQEGFDLARTL